MPDCEEQEPLISNGVGTAVGTSDTVGAADAVGLAVGYGEMVGYGLAVVGVHVPVDAEKHLLG